MIGPALNQPVAEEKEIAEVKLIHARTQLNDALMESYPDSRFGQFSLALEPLWAWVCAGSDPQDSIKELFNCVLVS